MKRRRRIRIAKLATIRTSDLIAVMFTVACYPGCAEGDRKAQPPTRNGLASRYVASLGNLTCGKPPSASETAVVQFLFGTEPDRPLSLIKPMDIAALQDGLLVADGALGSMMQWSAAQQTLAGVP